MGNPYNDHNCVKLIKVIYEKDHPGMVLGTEHFEEKMGTSLPFLQDMSKRNMDNEIFNYFKSQTALPLDDVVARYKRKHNQVKGFINL